MSLNNYFLGSFGMSLEINVPPDERVGELISETGHRFKLFLNKKKRRYYAIFPNNSERDVILHIFSFKTPILYENS